MAKLAGKKYGATMQKCISCSSICIVAGELEFVGGSVDLAICPAINKLFYPCAGKMVPIESRAVLTEIMDDLRSGL